MSNVRSGDYAHEIEARLTARILSKPMVGKCLLCPRWRARGKAADVLELQRLHREQEHGVNKRRSVANVPHLSSFRQPDLTEEDLAAIDAEVRRRAKLHGVEIET